MVSFGGDYILCGDIGGIRIVKNTKNGLKLGGRMALFNDMVNEIYPISDTVAWVQTRSDGIYKLTWAIGDSIHQPHYTHYDTTKGLPSMAYNKLFFDKGQTFIATEHLIYAHDTLADTFGAVPHFDGFFGDDTLGCVLFIDQL